KRDLESGHSVAMSSVSGTSRIEDRAAREVSRANSAPSNATPSAPRLRRGASTAAALAGLAIVALAGYWLWFRPPAAQPPAAQTSTASSNPSLDEALARGRTLLASGDADGASAALTAARAIDPASP